MCTGTRFIPDLLVYSLESQYDSFYDYASIDSLSPVYILILGGGSYYDPGLSPIDQLSRNSLQRLSEGIRLTQIYPNSILVVSGYSSGPPTQAQLMAEAAVSLGINRKKIVVLGEPKTTGEEALSFKNFIEDPMGALILVTNDLHMPRAVQLFRKRGLEPVPAPGGSILRKDLRKPRWGWSSDVSNFDKFKASIHEYIGMIWGK
ncbi:MAG TPA: ElyC/SanA/YdcF family protein [Saprospiraceae bacterium]|nr:ElyC/SanA/YdcF family protein [Saprospiraceae bacterium]